VKWLAIFEMISYLAPPKNFLPFAFCLLPFAFCLLPFAFCLLPFAYCLLPIVYCRLPIAPAFAYATAGKDCRLTRTTLPPTNREEVATQNLKE
jgi:hypothetical protein